MAHKNAELWKQYAEDASNHDEPWLLWECVDPSGKIYQCTRSMIMFNSTSVKWRRKPTKKPVDLSVLIESGIDCEFSNLGFGKLTKISEEQLGQVYIDHLGRSTDKCRPRMNHWHAWFGGECPLPEGFMVEVKCRGDNERRSSGEAEAFGFYWERVGNSADIIAFKVTGVADSHCMPWEADNDN